MQYYSVASNVNIVWLRALLRHLHSNHNLFSNSSWWIKFSYLRGYCRWSCFDSS